MNMSPLMDQNEEENINNDKDDGDSDSNHVEEEDEEFQPLISQDRESMEQITRERKERQQELKLSQHMHDDYSSSTADDDSIQRRTKRGKQKAAVLSLALCCLLLNFWMLDSLKDPVLEILTQNLQTSQPQAKMASVFSTLTLVCFMEYIGHERKRQEEYNALRRGEEVQHSTKISVALFYFVGIPYLVIFSVISFSLRGHPLLSIPLPLQDGGDEQQLVNDNSNNAAMIIDDSTWKILGYIQYVAIESYGSIGVAAFWSFTNSRLDLISAEQNYGFIIAVAQIGAIVGATISMTFGKLSSNIPTLYGTSAIMVFVTMMIMSVFNWLFPDHDGTRKEQDMTYEEELTDVYAIAYRNEINQNGAQLLQSPSGITASSSQGHSSLSPTHQGEPSSSRNYGSGRTRREPSGANTPAKSFLSGVYLILRHKYLMYILGVSCLYEVALTCLDYEMKLVGLAKFQMNYEASLSEAANAAAANGGIIVGNEGGQYDPLASSTAATTTKTTPSIEGAFASFMGHFGQVTNLLSLILSYYGFPWLMKNVGLRQTLPIFPSVLLCATVLIFAMTPNLWLIFICLALLKAMTYSINEPSKEILYIPTSNTIKLKAKFWIDVVGSRCAKALGSSITNYAGSADRLVTFGAVPSIMTGLILLAVSVRAGDEFDLLVKEEHVIGLKEELIESNTFRNQYHEVYLHDDDSDLLMSHDDDDDDDNKL